MLLVNYPCRIYSYFTRSLSFIGLTPVVPITTHTKTTGATITGGELKILNFSQSSYFEGFCFLFLFNVSLDDQSINFLSLIILQRMVELSYQKTATIVMSCSAKTSSYCLFLQVGLNKQAHSCEIITQKYFRVKFNSVLDFDQSNQSHDHFQILYLVYSSEA